MDATTPPAPPAPPANLANEFFPVFFLIISLLKNHAEFLVFHNGRLEWLLLHERLVDTVTQLRHQIPVHEINWQRLCQHFLTTFPFLLFDLGQQDVRKIDWKNVIFLRRTIMIRLENGIIVPAKYVENFGKMPCDSTGIDEHHIKCQIRCIDDEIIIPISAIVDHMPSKKVVEGYEKELKRVEQLNKEKADAEAAAKASDESREQLMKRGENVGFSKVQRYYPNFSQETLRILFLLCRRFNIVPDFTYQFNLTVLRLLSLGDQSRFPLPQLSEEDQEAFEAFEQKYNTEMVGRVIKSKTGRFQASSLPDHLHRCFEYDCFLLEIDSPTQEDADAFLQRGEAYFSTLATNMSTKSESALTFPESYWTQSEFGVELRHLKNPMPHLIFKMLASFPSDVFV